MTSRQRRVMKLESVTNAISWADGLEQVQELARRKLSTSDRVHLQQVLAAIESDYRYKPDSGEQAVLDRWDTALAEATKERNFPVLITWAEMLL